MNRVMIVGADGQAGTDLVKVFADESVIPLLHRDIEVGSIDSVRLAFQQHQPHVVINTAAYHNVDEAESKPELAFSVNSLGPRNLALLCREYSAILVHISSDYVFSGRQLTPYTETDVPFPVNVYGTSKLAGEHFVRAILAQSFIVRTTGLFGIAGRNPGRRNFIEVMLRLASEGREIKVVGDQTVSPTYTADLAQAIRELFGTAKFGAYHITNSEHCTWFEFASEIFRRVELTPALYEVSSAAFGAAATRPAYSVLSNQALTRAGVSLLRPWQKALDAYLSERKGPSP